MMMFDFILNMFYRGWNKAWIKQNNLVSTAVILCLQGDTFPSLWTEECRESGNHCSVFSWCLRWTSKKTHTGGEDGWNGAAVCSSTHTHTQYTSSKAPGVCMHVQQCECVCVFLHCDGVFDGRFYCFEPLKAPRFSLGEFSCRQLVSDQHVGGWKTNCTVHFKLCLVLMQKYITGALFMYFISNSVEPRGMVVMQYFHMVKCKRKTEQQRSSAATMSPRERRVSSAKSQTLSI